MGEAQAQARHQQKVEELCAAAIRALAGEADLHFRGRRLHRGRRVLPLFAPHLHPSLEADDFTSFRGAADGLALRLARSDAALHRRLAPADPVERLVFDLLEQIRVEATPPVGMPGVAHNLRHRFAQWSLAFHRSGLTESARGILLYTVAQVCRARVTGEPVLEETEDLMETTRGAIVPAFGHDLAALRRHRDDQRAYARPALAIAHRVARMVQSADDERGTQPAGDEPDDRTALARFMDLDDAAGEAGFPLAAAGRSRVLDASDDGYRVFTRAYDRELEAAARVRRPLLRERRERLDRRIAAQGVNLARLARELKALLAAPQRDDWDAGQEEGYVDGRRLAQLVASPAERRLFRIERREPIAQCLLTFLIDCSGSMKQHIEPVAMLVDVLARALEMAGVATEILGFTTGAWNGGRALRDWRRAGRPAHPGRLNEVCHIVFKAADTPWRRARPAIAALLEPLLFREGIDGEALDWACARMAGRPEERRLLLVVSDGCPMDGATQLANDPHYLEQHLRDVVQRHEQAGRVAIYGVGVGLDLSPYYGRSQALDLSAPPGNGVFREIVAMLAGHARR
ncbi:MAG: cobalt chelatase [Burkholderiaceae bacterium]|nr:cobalt chelatase [Burkholderiaceae bacterium]